MKIGVKITSTVIALLICVCGGLGFLSYQKSSQAIVSQVEDNLKEKAKDNARYIDETFQQSFSQLETIAAQKDITSMDWKTQKTHLKSELKRLKNYSTLGVITPDGNAKFLDGSSANLADRDYVKNAFNGETSISEVIISKATNKPVMSIATPIKNNQKVVGVLIARMDGYYLSDITDKISFGKTGYAYILNSEGTFLAHKDRDLVLNKVNYIEKAQEDSSYQSKAKFVKKILEGKHGVLDYELDGKERYMAYEQLSNGWTITIGAYKSEVLEPIDNLQKIMIIITIIFIILGVIITRIISLSITRPINEVVKIGEFLSQGDFTHKVADQFTRRKDEIGKLAKTFNHLTENITKMIKHVQLNSDNVNEASVAMSNQAIETTNMVKQIESSMDIIKSGANSQVQTSGESTKLIEEMTTGIQKLAEISTHIADDTNQINNRVNSGRQSVEVAVKQMDHIQNRSKETTTAIAQLEEDSNEIGQITNIIRDISEQTNLLALNASIEAARAGEAGKGFSVVADEIRKLAEQTANSVSKINELVNKIQGNTSNAVHIIDETRIDVEHGIKIVNEVGHEFETIAEAIISISDKINDMSAISEEMAAGTEEVSASVEEMAATAKEAANNVIKITNSTEQQLQSIEGISQFAQNLTQMADELKQTILQFKINSLQVK